jgi:hypothetical protein
MITLKAGEAIKRTWDINEIFDFEIAQDYTIDAGFYLIWFQGEETVFKLENGYVHSITSEMTPVTVVEVESFISRKLSDPITPRKLQNASQYYQDITSGSSTYRHYIGSYYYPCVNYEASII